MSRRASEYVNRDDSLTLDVDLPEVNNFDDLDAFLPATRMANFRADSFAESSESFGGTKFGANRTGRNHAPGPGSYLEVLDETF